MSTEPTSFNAAGQTVVAFETLDAAKDGPRAFGVGVSGTICGVYGEGGALNPEGVRATSVQSAGVYGKGDFYGIYGIQATIKSANAPDLVSSAAVGIGVVGVSENGPAVLGDNGVLQSDMRLIDPNKPETEPAISGAM